MKARVAVSGLLALLTLAATSSLAQIQNRAPTGGANITTRKCVGGTNSGAMCRAGGDCDSGNCFGYNLVDLTVNFLVAGGGTGWTPTAAQMTTIRGYFGNVNNMLADVTEGQMALGTVSLVVNNGAPNAAVQLQAGLCSAGGGACVTDADCGGGVCDGGGGVTQTGGWGANGRVTVGIWCLREPLCFVHEFVHLIGNARDEYEGALDDGIDNNADGQIDECQENQANNRCFGGTSAGQPCATNANCPGGGTCRRIVCRDGGPPAAPTSIPGCLMQCCLANTDSELCWNGNHDADLDTEQSQCRDNHSCWTQLGLEWPSVIQVPTAAPAPGPAVSPTTVGFLTPSTIDRFVAVIDRSNTMNLETPTRIGVAVTTARDFLDLLGDTAQFGLASFASADFGDPPGVDSTKDFPSELGLRTLSTAADRTAARAAIDGLSTRANGWTRIGAGLRTARDMLLENGGAVTLNTSILLLTDGLNNRPEADPQADLDAALADLSTAGIPVFVTCIGQARDSTQCSYIADRTAGRFVDSVETENVYDAFVEFAAAAQGLEIAAASLGTPIGEGELSGPIETRVEDGVAAAQFVLSWTRSDSDLDLRLFRPDGSEVDTSLKTTGSQGEFIRIVLPTPGTWTIRAFGADVPGLERFSARAIVDHQELNVSAGLARATIQWPEGFLLTASPIFGGLPVASCQVEASVVKPDGDTETVALRDDGTAGDNEANDGLYLALFRNFTGGDGIYTFEVRTRCVEGVADLAQDEEPGMGAFPLLPTLSTFERVVRFSGTVSGVPSNLPPVANVCQDVRAECQGVLTPVTVSGLCSSDPEGAGLTFAWSAPSATFADPTAAAPTGQFPLGRHTVSLVVTDPLGASSPPDDGLVVVADTTPPEITSLTANPKVLWPPNQKLVPVRIAAQVAESCDPAPSCSIVEVRSDDGGGPEDWILTGPLSLSLRAERTGGGVGRTYSVAVSCGDASGNHALETVTVTVPHDQGKKK